MNGRRTIRVLGTKVIKEGTGKNGKPYTLRSVEAANANGLAIDLQLKTFADLAPGTHEVEVEAQDHEKYGRSYMLSPVKGGGSSGSSGGDDTDLLARVARLESEVARLSSIVDRRDFEHPSEAEPFQSEANF